MTTEGTSDGPKNVLGGPLQACCTEPGKVRAFNLDFSLQHSCGLSFLHVKVCQSTGGNTAMLQTGMHPCLKHCLHPFRHVVDVVHAHEAAVAVFVISPALGQCNTCRQQLNAP